MAWHLTRNSSPCWVYHAQCAGMCGGWASACASYLLCLSVAAAKYAIVACFALDGNPIKTPPKGCAQHLDVLQLRRKYNLPNTFGLPPGCDDCCVHFFCMYCASHQVHSHVQSDCSKSCVNVLDMSHASPVHLHQVIAQMRSVITWDL